MSRPPGYGAPHEMGCGIMRTRAARCLIRHILPARRKRLAAPPWLIGRVTLAVTVTSRLGNTTPASSDLGRLVGGVGNAGPGTSHVRLTLATADVGFVAVSRAVVAAAADLVAEVERRVVGDERVRTAQGNAWAAICADRARAEARAEMDAMVAALTTETRRRPVRRGGQRAVGSSPRSSASQAALVSTR